MRFHWSLFLEFHWTISRHWFMLWLQAKQVSPNHNTVKCKSISHETRSTQKAEPPGPSLSMCYSLSDRNSLVRPHRKWNQNPDHLPNNCFVFCTIIDLSWQFHQNSSVSQQCYRQAINPSRHLHLHLELKMKCYQCQKSWCGNGDCDDNGDDDDDNDIAVWLAPQTPTFQGIECCCNQCLLGLCSLSGRTSYRKIPWSLEAARFGFKRFQISLKFGRHLGATEMPAKFHSDTISITSNLAASRLHDIW